MKWKRFIGIVMLLSMILSVCALPAVSAASIDSASLQAPNATERLSVPMVGIDVSSWNQEIDWAKVKDAGVEFAIVRVFHHLKNTPNYELDEQFERNVREAQKYGIQLGAYFFSYAQTLDAVKGEAEMVVNELNKYPGVFSFPIVFDAEDGDTTDDPNVSGNDIYDIGSFAGSACKTFCDILDANGYYPMVYSYAWYYEAKIGMENVQDYDLWLASYPRSGDKQIYAGTGPADAGSIDHSKREKLSLCDDNVTIWQYTGAGKIDGIYYGDGGAIVDLNVSYVDYPSIIKNGGYNGYTGNEKFQTQPLVYRTGANAPASTYLNSKYYTHVTSIGLTGDGVTDTLAAGLSQLGYYEGTASNPYSGLYNTYDQYTTNKTTEYVYNYGDADSSGYKMAWCASFCSWAIYQSRTANHSTHAQSCRNNIGNKTYIWRECSCYQWADQLKRFNMYNERGTYTPKAGDLIFFKMDGGGTAWTNHIGLVRYCDGSKVYTLEGNRHNHVILTSYSLSDTQICGYGILPYPTNDKAPKVDYSGKNKTEGQYITNNATLSVSATKGGSAAFTVGKYEMFDVTGFDGGYAQVSYKGSTGYATLNSDTIQVTATNSAYVAEGMNVSVDADSIKNSSYAAGSSVPEENNNSNNPNVYITGLREDSNSYKGLENYGTNKDKIMINGRTWEKWESRSGTQILNNIWIYGAGEGNAYLGIDIADTSRLRVQGVKGHGEEIETIVLKRGFEIVKTDSNLWSNSEISADGLDVESVVGILKENVILVANDSGGFDVILGGSDSLGLEGYTFTQTEPQILQVNADVNIRSGPGTSYPSIGIAYNGDSFEYLGEAQGNFHKIDYNGQVAWISVNNNLSSLVNVPKYVVVTSYEVNIRSGPDTSYSVLGNGFNGDRFEYLGEIQNEKWLKVDYNGQTAWISNVNAAIEESEKIVNVTAQNLDWVEEPIVHTFGDWLNETEATCTQGGVQKRVCDICDLEETRNTDPLGHDWGEWVVTKSPTETEAGEETRTCKIDPSHTETREIPPQLPSYSISYNESENYTLTGDTSVEQGDDYEFTVKPSEGFRIYAVIYDMQILEAVDGVYIIPDVRGDINLLILTVEDASDPATKEYTVTFIGFDGTVLSEQTVASGMAAVAPKAPVVDGYTFTGWDVPFDNINGDTTVTAQYKKTATPTLPATGRLKVEVVGGTGFTIALDGGSPRPQGSAYRNTKIALGTEVTVVAQETADAVFVGWMNPATGIILSADFEYTFISSGNDAINAMFNTMIDGVQVVTFKNDKSNRILDSQYYASTDAVTFPDAPTQVGYVFAGWSMTEAEIQSAIAKGEDVTVVALWTKSLVPVEVTVNGGTGSGTYYANNAVTVTANEAEMGQKFAYWTDAEGNIRSYNAEYTFFPSADTIVTAVFVDEDEAIDYQILVSMDSIDTTTVAGKNVFTYSWYCPEQYTFVKAGIVAVNKDNYNEATFVAGSSDANVYDRIPSGDNLKPVNTFTWTKSNVASGQTWVAKAYVQYRDAQGQIQTVYSDIIEAAKE